MNRDETFMQRCLSLAQLGEEWVAPNPMVGCVIVYKNAIVSEGYHQAYGQPHAEVNAFNNISSTIPISDCEIYVSLEPCSHFGKTPPCADLIISKRPKRVVIGMLDPNPKVAGSGIAKIRNSGIEVLFGVLEPECKLLNKKFICFHSNKRPYITLKWAETSDGFMGRVPYENHKSKQISSERNKAFVHYLRTVHTAIMVGANTINRDHPMLDVRHWKGNNPLKIVVSKALNVNIDLPIFKTGFSLLLNGIKEEKEGNIEFVLCDDFSIVNLINTLYNKGVQSILVEGGAELLAQFIDSNLWDEAIVFRSNKEWKKGIKAPLLGKNPIRSVKQNGDKISFYENQWL